MTSRGQLRLQSWTYELHTATRCGFYGHLAEQAEGSEYGRCVQRQAVQARNDCNCGSGMLRVG